MIFGKVWAYIFWPESWRVETREDITFSELVPIVLGIALRQKRCCYVHIDNLALVLNINQNTKKPLR